MPQSLDYSFSWFTAFGYPPPAWFWLTGGGRKEEEWVWGLRGRTWQLFMYFLVWNHMEDNPKAVKVINFSHQYCLLPLIHLCWWHTYIVPLKVTATSFTVLLSNIWWHCNKILYETPLLLWLRIEKPSRCLNDKHLIQSTILCCAVTCLLGTGKSSTYFGLLGFFFSCGLNWFFFSTGNHCTGAVRCSCPENSHPVYISLDSVLGFVVSVTCWLHLCLLLSARWTLSRPMHLFSPTRITTSLPWCSDAPVMPSLPQYDAVKRPGL